ncbi:MAG TPA: hypothetical protein VLO07_00435 [Thermoanaerobaculia bacterium]|nr:hypothetical protein [Thermoanaerobaculia bacterium]
MNQQKGRTVGPRHDRAARDVVRLLAGEGVGGAPEEVLNPCERCPLPNVGGGVCGKLLEEPGRGNHLST